MTTPVSTCADLEATLAERLDGSLPAQARAACDTHVSACARCAALAADLEQSMSDAHALPELTPSRDLWPDIAARIAPRVLELPAHADRVGDAAPAPVRARASAAWRRVAAAAALVTVSVGVTYAVVRRAQPTDGRVIASGPGQPVPPRPIAVSRPSGVEALSSEVEKLEQAVTARERERDPHTVAVLQQSFAVIDRAIADARAALEADPANTLLDQHLTRVLGKKVELLRRAAVLPART